MKLAWIHYLRILAAFGVVLIHASSNAVFGLDDTTSLIWEVGNICNGCARWTVPVFVMISGYLLLEPGYETVVHFYRHRLNRLLIPSAVAIGFFSLIALALEIHRARLGHPGNSYFEMNVIASAVKLILKNVATGYPFYHLWYLYMITSLFLLTPLFRKIIAMLGIRSLGILCVGLFAATLVFVFYRSLVQQKSCLYIINEAHFTTWFLPYLGYYFSGYFFRIQNYRPPRWVLFLVFIASVVATVGLCRYYAARGNLEMGLFFYSFYGITAIPMSLSLFLIFKNISFKENQTIEALGNLTFGVYLIHPMFQMAAKAIGLDPLKYMLAPGIPLLALVVFIMSGAVIYALLQLINRREMKTSMDVRMTMPPDTRTTMF